MSTECHELKDAYLSWLREGIDVRAFGKTCELTTPFLDRHNDHIQVYATRQDSKILLTDDGYILADLKMCGADPSTPKRRELLDTTLRGFGVTLQSDALVVEATRRTIGQKIHTLIQAMLAVNDMFVLAQPRVQSLFWEDVREFLDQRDVRYSPRVKIAGHSGFDHLIDFVVPKSRKRPERFVQAINQPSKSTVGNCLFALEDTRKGRGDHSEAYAFLNDQSCNVGGDLVEALQKYEINAVFWGEREKYAKRLAG